MYHNHSTYHTFVPRPGDPHFTYHPNQYDMSQSHGAHSSQSHGAQSSQSPYPPPPSSRSYLPTVPDLGQSHAQEHPFERDFSHYPAPLPYAETPAPPTYPSEMSQGSRNTSDTPRTSTRPIRNLMTASEESATRLNPSSAARKKSAIDAFVFRSLLVPENFTMRPGLPSVDDLMKLDGAVLRMKAKENSKRKSSEADTEFFVGLNLLWEKVIAINALNRRVSIEMVESIIGKRRRMRPTNAWHRFQKTQAQAFKEEKGVGNGVGIQKVSQKWKNLTPEEKAEFDLPETHDEVEVSGTGGPNLVNNLVTLSTDPTLLLAKSHSRVRNRDRVDEWLSKWQKEANRLALTESCGIVVVAVSTDLSHHGFQLVRATPNATAWLDAQKQMNPSQSLAAVLQAFVTGTEVDLISKGGKTGPKSKTTEVNKCRTRLNNLISTHSGGLYKIWPWTKCDEKLAKMEYELVVVGGRADLIRALITHPNNKLVEGDAKKINVSLDSHHIKLVDMEEEDTSFHVATTAAENPTKSLRKRPRVDVDESDEDVNSHSSDSENDIS